ncbi:pyroglutamyl-peptidase I [Gemella sp. GH3]|nr:MULTISPECIES: pyroglutamyl-peptidase I [unclassified Gemella]MBF0713515.1 pyroglutamyl-peptidase I [Gemella sp. GH3.1]NYS50467.1 pyroglutamyl-peptidase I [Gemella sp. GH3]
MKILITGFDPFGGEKINPSAEAIKLLPKHIKDCEIITKTIPTVFELSAEVLKKEILEHNPDIVICIGQAGGSSNISIERVAINIDDARIPDNNGNTPVDKKIKEDGANAYFSTLPIKAIITKLNENNIPAKISNSAGTFVCNHIMYQSLYLANQLNNNFKTGFIHIPFLPEQIGKAYPSMSLENIITAIEIIIETTIDYFYIDDINVSYGTEF